jgi:hypothetical protein
MSIRHLPIALALLGTLVPISAHARMMDTIYLQCDEKPVWIYPESWIVEWNGRSMPIRTIQFMKEETFAPKLGFVVFGDQAQYQILIWGNGKANLDGRSKTDADHISYRTEVMPATWEQECKVKK